MKDRIHRLIDCFFVFIIVGCISFLFLLLRDSGQDVASLTELAVEPNVEPDADALSNGTSLGIQLKNRLEKVERDPEANKTLAAGREDSLIVEAARETGLPATKTLTQRQDEGLMLEAERDVNLPANESLSRRSDERRAFDAKHRADSPFEANQATLSESAAEPTVEQPLSPAPIINGQADLRERTLSNSSGQSVTASPSDVSSPIPSNAPVGSQNRASQPSKTTAAGSFVTEAEARLALSGVGYDPTAEMVWIAAINDPYLPEDTRRNLIEDLNEDGFPDRRNITGDDLPLVMIRMALIEDLIFDAKDAANAEAFLEAYKDLTNMYYRITRR